MIEPFKSPLYITKPLLPDIYEINEMIKSIWDSNQLTNNAGMVKRLERDLAGFLGADYLSVFQAEQPALEIAYKI